MKTKREILEQLCEDLPTADVRGEMTNDEWYAWLEEAFDKGVKYEQDLSKKLVEIKEDTIDQLLTGLDQIVEEYQDVRGRGESK